MKKERQKLQTFSLIHFRFWKFDWVDHLGCYIHAMKRLIQKTALVDA